MEIKDPANQNGETTPVVTPTAPITTPAPAAQPTATTPTAPATPVPAPEMTAEQRELYNRTLRNISKTAHSQLQERYNAFEDREVKAAVKKAILEGKEPKASDFAASVVARAVPKAKVPAKTPQPTGTNTRMAELEAEVALMRAGVKPDRIDAAKKLFVAEGGKVVGLVARYPEWKAGADDGVAFSRANPIDTRTAPAPKTNPQMNDFERKVAAMRKSRGLE